MAADIGRREFLAGAALALAAGTPRLPTHPEDGPRMYGLIGRMTAVSGERDALVQILLEGVAGMPGCLSYVVAEDPDDGDALWITEVWESKEAHEASLTLPSVREAIGKGRPLIAGMDQGIVTTPVGGHGL